jgi:orotate phosphoribosyltransferase
MNSPNALSLSREIYETCHITGRFVLRSGLITNEYFDKYMFESNPRLLDSIAQQMVPLIPNATQVLAGLEMGGIPVVTMLSHYSGLPAVFVRKQPKEHGTAKLSEGTDIKNCNVLIVEDVVTTGGQIVISSADLRALGAAIDHALCVIDREQGGVERLRDESNITLLSLFKRSELESSA